ncbi:hypothetical protein SuNHUV7_15470 (plasmid) [Pseudoseohaeicola sp. NH-UV-7]
MSQIRHITTTKGNSMSYRDYQSDVLEWTLPHLYKARQKQGDSS